LALNGTDADAEITRDACNADAAQSGFDDRGDRRATGGGRTRTFNTPVALPPTN
jgi:hypothetical protein